MAGNLLLQGRLEYPVQHPLVVIDTYNRNHFTLHACPSSLNSKVHQINLLFSGSVRKLCRVVAVSISIRVSLAWWQCVGFFRCCDNAKYTSVLILTLSARLLLSNALPWCIRYIAISFG